MRIKLNALVVKKLFVNLLLLLVGGIVGSAQTTFTVTNTDDSGTGSLRQAILDANANPGGDIINFSIGTGAQSITITTQLPTVNSDVTIDGSTQPGFASTTLIKIGENWGGAPLSVQSTSNTVLNYLDFSKTGTQGGEVQFIGNYNLTVTNCSFKNRLYGLNIESVYTSITATGNDLSDCTVAMRLNNIQGTINISNNTIGGTTQNGIQLFNSSNIELSQTSGNIKVGNQLKELHAPLYTNSCTNLNLHDLDLGKTGTLGSEVQFVGNYNLTVTNCSFKNRLYGLNIESVYTSITATGNDLSDCTVAMRLNNIQGTINISNNTIGGTTQNGIQLFNSSNIELSPTSGQIKVGNQLKELHAPLYTNICTNLNLHDLDLGKTGAQGGEVQFVGNYNLTVTNCIFKNRLYGLNIESVYTSITATGNDLSDCTVAMRLNNIQGTINISNNTIGGTTQNGIQLFNSSNIELSPTSGQIKVGNQLKELNAPLYTNSCVNLNLHDLDLGKTGTIGSEVQFNSNSNLTVTNCIFKNRQYGLNIESAYNGLTATGNDLSDCTFAMRLNNMQGTINISNNIIGGTTQNGIQLFNSSNIELSPTSGQIKVGNQLKELNAPLYTNSCVNLNLHDLDLGKTGALGSEVQFVGNYNLTVTNCSFKNRLYGLNIESVYASITATGNDLSDCTVAMRLNNIQGTINISNNIIGGTTQNGIQLFNSSNIELSPTSGQIKVGNQLKELNAPLYTNSCVNLNLHDLDLGKSGALGGEVSLNSNNGVTVQRCIFGNRNQGLAINGYNGTTSITCNAFAKNNYGIFSNSNSDITATNNTFLCNTIGVYSNGNSINAQGNYWGSANAPTSGGANGYQGNVDATNQLATAAGCAAMPSNSTVTIAGNNVVINSGDSTPSTTDATDFGTINLNSSTSKTYTIANNSATSLTVNDITIDTPNNFTVSGVSFPLSISANQTATFVVTQSAASQGTKTATVHVITNDCLSADYNFAIKAVITCPNASLTSPGNKTFTTPCSGGATYTIVDPISDICNGATWGYSFSGATTGSASNIADGTNSNSLTFNNGVTTVTLTGMGANGNAVSSVSFTVTVSIQSIASNLRVWTNCGGNNLWSNPANWSNNAVPTSGQTATFDGTSSANCILDINTTINSLSVAVGYNGVINLSDKTLIINAGISVATANQINAGTSLVKIAGSSTVNSATSFYNFEIAAGGGADVNFSQDAIILNSFTLTSVNGMGGGRQIQVSGNVVINDDWVHTGPYGGTGTTISLRGSSDQTLSGTGQVSYLNVAKTGGDVLLTDNLDLGNSGTLTGSGLLKNSGGKVRVTGTYNLNYGGTMDDLEIAAGGADVQVSQDVIVLNSFTLTSVNGMGGGRQIQVSGNVVINDAWVHTGPYGGTGTTISLRGSSNQTLSGIGQVSYLNVSKTGGDVLLTDNLDLGNSGTLTGSGLLKNSGGKVHVNGTYNLNYGGTMDDLEIAAGGADVQVSQDVIVLNSFTLTSVNGMGGGRQIQVSGNVVINDAWVHTGPYGGTGTTISLRGSSDQTLSGTGQVSYLNVAKTGGDVLLTDNLDLGNSGTLTGSGLLKNSGGKVRVTGTYNLNYGGTMDDLEVAAGTGADVQVSQDAIVLNSFTLTSVNGMGGGRQIQISGNVVINDDWVHTGPYGGTGTTISLRGSSDQTLSGTGQVSYLNIAKTGGDVLLTDNLDLGNSGTLTGSGLLKNSGGKVRVTGTYNLNYGGTMDDLEVAAGTGTDVQVSQDAIVLNSFTLTSVNGMGGGRQIQVSGNVVINDAWGHTGSYGGTGTTISLRGSTDQTISGTGQISYFNFNKPSGNAIFNASFNKTFTTCNITNGTWTLLGDSFTCGSGFIATGGFIGGEGTLTGPVTLGNNAGLAPGSSPGCLNINGNVVFQAGSKYKVDLNGATACSAFDKINVTGNISYGGTLEATFGYLPTAGATYQIANVSGSKAGNFTIPSGLYGYTFTPSTGILALTSVPTAYYRDFDNDTYGDAANYQLAQTKPSGYVTNNTDCNDNNASIYPNATEIVCNGIDEDCNGTDLADTTPPTIACASDVTIYPTAGNCTASTTLTQPTVNDNCGITSVVSNAPSSYNLGITTVTWTATDNAGLTATCIQKVTVIDNIAPTITCTGDVTLSTDAGQCTATANLTNPTGSDNCTAIAVTFSNNAPTTFQAGSTTVTWTATDGSGNTATCTQVVTVIDNQIPNITCPASVTANNNIGLCSAVLNYATPLGTDNCSGQTTAQTAGLASGAAFPIGTTTNTFVVTAANNQTASCSFTVTVIDNEVPTITCADVTLSTDVNACTTTTVLSNPSFSDNCANATISSNAPSAFEKGETTVTWTVTDASGNAATCSQKVTVIDNVAPAITCHDVTLNLVAGQCTFANNLPAPAATDNCNGYISIVSDAGADFSIGNTVVTWTATDEEGNSSTCTQLVTVKDVTVPIAACKNIAVQLDATGNATITTAQINNGSSDACGIVSMSLNNNTFNCSHINSMPVIPVGQSLWARAIVTHSGGVAYYNITDAGLVNWGNFSGCGVQRKISTSALEGFQWTDKLPSGTIITSVSIEISLDFGSTGASRPFYFNSLLQGNQPFLSGEFANCVGGKVTRTLSPANYVVGGTNTFSYDLGANNYVLYPANNNFFNGPKDPTVILTVTDNGGNSNTCTAIVSVQDNIIPAITCPDAVTFSTDANACTKTMTLASPSFTDNCANVTISSNAPIAFAKGETTVTWTVTDAGGNTATCTQLVTVVDNVAPAITCGGDATLNTDAGQCTATNNLTTPTATDNCSGTVSVTSNASASMPKGVNTIIWTATDAAGNTSTCSQVVTVIDNQAPTITCLDAVTFSTDANACTKTITLTSPSFTDNCANATISSNAPAAFAKGETIVTWTATDASGNTTTCTQNVTVIDAQAPTITCPTSVTLNTDANACTKTITLTNPSFSDNCSGATISSDAPAIFQLGVTRVTWTAVDAVGNTSTCAQDVSVMDNNPPTITCSGDITLNTDAGQCTASVNLITPTGSDNCTPTAITGNGLRFDGVDDVVTGSGAGLPLGNSARTMEFWIKREVSYWNSILGYGTSFWNGCNLIMENGIIHLWGSGLYGVATTTPLPLNTWTHVAMTWDGTTLKYYINGVLNASYTKDQIDTPVVLNTTLDNGGFQLAQPIQWTADPYLGSLDEIRIWNTARSASQIAANYNQQLTGTESGLVRYYNFNQGVANGNNSSVTTLTATTGANATLSNFALSGTTSNWVGGNSFTPAAVTFSNNAPTTLPKGSTTVTWTATDAAGNTATCTQKVTVIDAQAPTITCTPSITVNAAANQCSAIATLTAPTVTDNCPMPTNFKNALRFDGTNDVVVLDNNLRDGINGGTALTIEYWFKGTNIQSAFRLQDISNAYIVSGWNSTPGSNPKHIISTDGGTNGVNIGNSVLDGNWHHIAMTWQKNTVNGFKSYVDGVLIAQRNTANVNLPTVSQRPTLGGYFASGADQEYMNGSLDEVKVWNVARSATDIQTGMNMELTGSESNLLAYYNFNQGVPAGSNSAITSLPDLATTLAGTNNGTLTNFALTGATSNWANSIGNPITNNAPSVFQTGNTTVTWTATDASGNTSTCSQEVTVIDNQAPTITCASNITVNAAPGLCTATPTLVAPTVSDNCSTPAGNGLHFDGSNDYLESSPLALGTNDFTVETWAYANSFGSFPVIFGQDKSGNGTTTFRLEVTTNASNTLLFHMADPTGNSAIYYTNTAMPLNKWVHLAVVRSGNTYTTYMDGIARGSVTTTGSVNQSTNSINFRIGARSNASNTVQNPFNGSVDEFRVWGFAKTPSQITAQMNSELNGNESGLIRYYNLNQGIAGGTNTGLTTVNATVGVNATLFNFGLAGATSNWVAGALAASTASLTLTNNAPTAYPVGSTTVTWTVTDLSGNTATCTQKVTVVDTQAPTITCNGNVTLNADAGQCTATTTLSAPSATDNCAVTVTSNAPTTFQKGNTTVTWTATDGSGNTSTCTQIVTVKDVVAPTITCAPNITINAAANQCSATATLTVPTVTDNCALVTGNALDFDGVNDYVNLTTDNLPTGNADHTVEFWLNFKSGQTEPKVILWSGNNLGNQQAVYIVDPTNSNRISVNHGSAGNAGVFNTQMPLNQWTHLAFVYRGQTKSIDLYLNGTFQQSLTYTANLNLSTNTFQFGALYQSFFRAKMQLDEVRVWNVARTANQIQSLMNNELDGNEANLARYFKFNQGIAEGNNSTVSTLNATTGGNGSLINFNLSGSNSNWVVGAPISILPSNNAPATFPIGLTTVTWSATDGAGNTATCTQTVTVIDNQAPTITCPQPLTLNADANACSKTITLTNPSFTDNCPNVTISSNAPATFPMGLTTVTWTAVDAVGNTAVCTQDVTVVDNIAPTITCSGNITMNTDAGQCTASVNLITPTSSDNCTPTPITGNGLHFDGVNDAVQIDDFSNLNFTKNNAFTIEAYAKTTASGQRMIFTKMLSNAAGTGYQIYLQNGAFGFGAHNAFNLGNTLVVETTTGGFNDGNWHHFAATYDGTATPNGVKLYVDGTLRAQTAVFNNLTGEITNTAKPEIGRRIYNGNPFAPFNGSIDEVRVWNVVRSASEISAYKNQQLGGSETNLIAYYDFNQGSANGTNTGVTNATDKAGGDNNGTLINFALSGTTSNWVSGNTFTPSAVTISNNAPTAFQAGNTTVIWTATDAAGNTSTCSQVITVIDNQAPTITCPAAITLNVAVNACTATATLINPTATDNCGAVTFSNNALTNFPVGTTTVTWTAADGAGNTATCTQQVTVIDNQAPTITCPNNLTVGTDTNLATASNVALGTPVTTENCNIKPLTNNALLNYPVGITNVVWTVTDLSNNTATCMQTVTVKTLPSIICGASTINLNTDNGQCTASATLSTPAISANNLNNNAPLNALDFALGAPTDYVDCGNNTALQTNGKLTLEAWIYADSWRNNFWEGSIINKEQNIPDFGYMLRCGANGTLGFTIGNGAWMDCNSAAGALPLAQWVHVAATYDGTSMKLYINGNLVKTVAKSNGLSNAARNLYIGNSQADPNRGFNGKIDAARIWNIARTQADIQGTMNLQMVGAIPGLVASYNFDSGVAGTSNPTVNTAINNQGNAALNGTLYNFTLSGTKSNWVTGKLNMNLQCNAPLVYPIGNTSVTWTAIDATGNSNNCTQTVIVTDIIKPILSYNNQTISTLVNSCNATYTILNPISDNCTGVKWSYTLSGATTGSASNLTGNSSPITLNLGVTTVNLTGVDASGNTATPISFTITVRDLAAPYLTGTLPSGSKILACYSGATTAPSGVPTFASIKSSIEAAYTDVCNAPVTAVLTGTSVTGGFETCGWTSTYTFKVLDALGNELTGQTVSYSGSGLTNNTPPVFNIVSDITTNNFGVSQAIANIAENITSPCGSKLTMTMLSDVKTNLTPPPCMTYSYVRQITWRATDACGNSSTATQRFVASGLELTCPSDKTINTNSDAVANYNCSTLVVASLGVAPQFLDGCDLSTLRYAVTGATTSNGSGSIAGIPLSRGVNNVSYNLVSSSADKCTFKVTVLDNEAPQFGTIANAVLDACDLPNPITMTAPSTSDNCSGVISVTPSMDVTATVSGCSSKVAAQKYTKSVTRTWTATDASGNTSTKTQTMYLRDMLAPTAICKDITVYIGASNVSVLASQINNNSNDNCTAAAALSYAICRNISGVCSFSSSISLTASLIPTGVNFVNLPVSLRVTDVCGNVGTCNATIRLQKLGTLINGKTITDLSTQSDSPAEIGTSKPTIPSNIDATHGSFKCFPNPFIDNLNLEYNLTHEVSKVTLKVYDNQGRLVTKSEQGEQLAGYYQVNWNLSDLQAGMYHICLEIDGKCMKMERVIMLK